MKFQVNPRLNRSEPLQRCNFPACEAACCLHGAWVDSIKAAEITRNADLIQPFLPESRAEPDRWFVGPKEADPYVSNGQVIHTMVLEDPEHYGGTACVFLREDYKCALQLAGMENGFHPWHFKPFYCILHPLDLDDKGRITLDQNQPLLNEPASCLRPSGRPIPLQETFARELSFLTN